MHASRLTTVTAFSAILRGSRKPGKHEPLRSLGNRCSIEPARVSQSQARWTLRRIRRARLFPPFPTPASGHFFSIKPLSSEADHLVQNIGSAIFSTRRRFIISLVIRDTSVGFKFRNPIPVTTACHSLAMALCTLRERHFPKNRHHRLAHR
jgi:hypothetical protein